MQSGRVIPSGMLVCHTCDSPPCCNPAHLFVGTVRDNVMDMARKGRRKGRQAQIYLLHKSNDGINNPRAKLTQEIANRIRVRYRAGESMPSLARQYGVSHGAVWFIVKNKHWITPQP